MAASAPRRALSAVKRRRLADIPRTGRGEYVYRPAREITRRIDAERRVKAGLHIVWIQLCGNSPCTSRVLRRARRECQGAAAALNYGR